MDKAKRKEVEISKDRNVDFCDKPYLYDKRQNYRQDGCRYDDFAIHARE